MRSVLVVDDKEMMRDSVASTLRRAGMDVTTAVDGRGALDAIALKRPDVVITDQRMPGIGGIELIEKIRQIDEDLPVIVMTAFGSIETAVKAMRLGAFDYLTKPFEGDELVIAAKRAIDHGRLVRDNALLRLAAADAGRPMSCASLGGDGAPTGSSASLSIGGSFGASISGNGPGVGANGATGGAMGGPSGAHAGPGMMSASVPLRGVSRLIGSSRAMRDLRAHVAAVAASQGTALVCGESGVGKEVVARAIHESSPRAVGAFLAVNCAALSESLLESELFGHERGAFTGAEKTRKGRFELADGGTLLLDEVSEVPPQIQAKLLRVLQERAFERVGSSITIGIDVRVVATSNRDLQKTIDDGGFRQDLYFRLNVLPVVVPPLRERAEDVPDLARHFTGEICRREGRGMVEFDARALDLLREYHWPGNVRELQNICERAVVLSASPSGRPGDRLGAGSGPAAASISGSERVTTIGRELIEPWLTSGRRPSAGTSLGSPIGQSGHASAGHSPTSSLARAFPGSAMSAMPSETTIEAKPASMMPGVFNGSGATQHAAASLRTLEEIEREAIIQALTRFNGHRQRTAHALGIGVRTLGLKLKRWKELQLVESTL